VKAVGNGINELRIHYGPGIRVYFQQRGSTVIILLCGGDKRSHSRDVARAKQLAAHSEFREMNEKLLPHDPAESLTTPQAIEYFVNDALEEGDPG
jgi:hypothetical protein